MFQKNIWYHLIIYRCGRFIRSQSFSDKSTFQLVNGLPHTHRQIIRVKESALPINYGLCVFPTGALIYKPQRANSWVFSCNEAHKKISGFRIKPWFKHISILLFKSYLKLNFFYRHNLSQLQNTRWVYIMR